MANSAIIPKINPIIGRKMNTKISTKFPIPTGRKRNTKYKIIGRKRYNNPIIEKKHANMNESIANTLVFWGCLFSILN